MRQFLLVIVLVGAAFGGGALVSGPGFRWAQEHLLDYMGLKDGGEIDSLELTPSPDAQARQTAIAAAEPPRAPDPRAAPAPPAVSDRDLPTLPEPKVTEPFKETQVALSESPDPAPAPAPAPSPTPAAEPAKGGGPALLGALSSILSPAPASAPAPTPAPAASPTPPPTATSEPRTAPPALLDPGVSPSSIPSAASAAGGDWGEIRRKLAAAGVSRYEIEGDPAGSVVFSCLIPLAGKQAVSQRFEAEGDDELQAALAALKRINLWRASQGAAPSAH